MHDSPSSEGPGSSGPNTLLAVTVAIFVAAFALAWPLFQRLSPPAEPPALKAAPPYSPAALEALLEADQLARSQTEIDWDSLRKADTERRQTVGAWLDRGWITSGRGLWCAAMIFQHGNTAEDYKRARDLAQRAVAAGHTEARWLQAACEDRWLLAQDKPQRYGTQFQEVDGRFQLAPFDPTVTDEERARFDVPALAESQRRARDMNAPE